MNALIIGDLHIPYRSSEIPQVFIDKIKSSTIKQIWCTGNLCRESELKHLKEICQNICKKTYIVHGELDPEGLISNEIKFFTVGSFRVVLLSSYLAFSESMICMKQREYDADIVVIGGSHIASIKKFQDFHVIDPGTATGAFNSSIENPSPSFIIIEILGYIATATIYTLEKDGSVSTRTETFQKQI